MVHLTLTDHYKIKKIVQLISFEKKLRNKKNKLLQKLHQIYVRRIKKLDESYFQPRVIEMASERYMNFVEGVKITESHHMYFNFFKEILQGKFKKHSNH